MILEFGKHKGKDLREVPAEYIQWLLAQRKADVSEYEIELARRQAVEDGNLNIGEQIIRAGFRALAPKYHPDTGGSTTAFQELNAAHEQLKALYAEVKRLR